MREASQNRTSASVASASLRTVALELDEVDPVEHLGSDKQPDGDEHHRRRDRRPGQPPRHGRDGEQRERHDRKRPLHGGKLVVRSGRDRSARFIEPDETTVHAGARALTPMRSDDPDRAPDRPPRKDAPDEKAATCGHRRATGGRRDRRPRRGGGGERVPARPGAARLRRGRRRVRLVRRAAARDRAHRGAVASPASRSSARSSCSPRAGPRGPTCWSWWGCS